MKHETDYKSWLFGLIGFVIGATLGSAATWLIIKSILTLSNLGG